MKGDERMKRLGAATVHVDDGDTGDLGASTPNAPSGEESMEGMEAATVRRDDVETSDLGKCTPIAPRVESICDVHVSQAADSICTTSVEVNMGSYNEVTGNEVEDDVA
ncbi:hypothetical protein HanHA300_Chr00c0516g0776161 [Helianthus annuus]|nr:hypothetical protein HanHA89_Chr10g0374631 [Helianthus annuus]KAJ0630072.1 hypothetical protein HanHA300_Chr00c0516g0776161 [Helianthus annuus]KAJ0696044.1 hypothetical protein HanLR1_Chr10g0352481 [Helianthus annuus]